MVRDTLPPNVLSSLKNLIFIIPKPSQNSCCCYPRGLLWFQPCCSPYCGCRHPPKPQTGGGILSFCSISTTACLYNFPLFINLNHSWYWIVPHAVYVCGSHVGTPRRHSRNHPPHRERGKHGAYPLIILFPHRNYRPRDFLPCISQQRLYQFFF